MTSFHVIQDKHRRGPVETGGMGNPYSVRGSKGPYGVVGVISSPIVTLTEYKRWRGRNARIAPVTGD